MKIKSLIVIVMIITKGVCKMNSRFRVKMRINNQLMVIMIMMNSIKKTSHKMLTILTMKSRLMKSVLILSRSEESQRNAMLEKMINKRHAVFVCKRCNQETLFL